MKYNPDAALDQILELLKKINEREETKREGEGDTCLRN